MKQILLIFSLFCASYMTVNAQTNTWNGAGGDSKWNTASNWSLGVPSATHDVVIPTGSTVNLNVAGTMKSISVQGNATFNILNTMTFTNASSFAKGTTVVWSSGGFYGGGVLTNNGVINMTTAAAKYIYEGSIVNNSGEINMSAAFALYIYAGSINNQNSGIIDIQDLPNIAPYTSQSHSIANSGTIKKTGNTGTATISVAMTNSGTITVESGSLNLTSEAKTFQGGTYNVATGATLNLSTTINLSGEMKGLLNGNLNWNNTMMIADETAFNFTGTTGINWVSGSLDGGGILTNMTKLNMTTAASKYIHKNSTLNNTGIINCTGAFALYIYEGTLNNQPTGVIDIQSLPSLAPYTAATHSIVNSGLIKKTADSGTATISVALTNTGTISVEKGTLNLTGEAKSFNGGVYNVTAGALMNLSTKTLCSGALTGALAGPMSWNDELNVATGETASLNFSGTGGFNWNRGTLTGGGTLNNLNDLNLISASAKTIDGATILKNSGTITCSGDFALYIYEGALNNDKSGIIDIQGASTFAPYTARSHSINNSGLIKKTVETGTATISVALNNTGIIAVESGELNLTGEAKTFDGGTYNVSDRSLLDLSAQVNCSGTLTGVATGPISWNNVINVTTTNPATFNFTGTSGINWARGSLSGGGILTNAGKLNMTTAASKYIYDGSTLRNTDEINCLDNFALYIYEGVFDNQSSGVIDIQSLAAFAPYTSASKSIVNSGLIKKTTNSGVSQISVALTNSGTIDAQVGTLQINANPFVNTEQGIIKGIATVDLPAIANYTNAGTFAPGGSPGILTVVGDYKSSTTSVLDVELFGLASGTDHDVLAISGNGVFEGNVNVNLNFAPKINDKFVVATTKGTISKCGLTANTTATFEGMEYAFNVACANNKEVVLTLSKITLGMDDYELSEASIKLYPNPVKNRLTIQNNENLQLENGQILDFTGKVVNTYNLKNMGTAMEISLENYATGMYFFQIKGNHGTITKRIVKQ